MPQVIEPFFRERVFSGRSSLKAKKFCGYWSSSQSSNNYNNAYKLNFSNGNVNNNNKNNNNNVLVVRDFTQRQGMFCFCFVQKQNVPFFFK